MTRSECNRCCKLSERLCQYNLDEDAIPHAQGTQYPRALLHFATLLAGARYLPLVQSVVVVQATVAAAAAAVVVVVFAAEVVDEGAVVVVDEEEEEVRPAAAAASILAVPPVDS